MTLARNFFFTGNDAAECPKYVKILVLCKYIVVCNLINENGSIAFIKTAYFET